MKLTRKEEAGILRRRHAAKVRKERGKKITQRPFAEKGRERDPGYLSWLHGVGCIACRILGPGPREHANIEAAHQKAQDAARGWHKLMGRRVHDRQCCALCAWHHRMGPTCCDPAQAKFWSVLNVDVIAYCGALHAAYLAGGDGNAVMAQFAQRRAAA